MRYHFTGVASKTEALALFQKAVPILIKWKAPGDFSTVEWSNPENVVVVDGDGKETSEVGRVTLEIPSFDELRAQNLQVLVSELATKLGIPVCTQDAAIKAGFPPKP